MSGTVAAGRASSSRYTSFQCSRLTGAYGLGSKGSSRKAAYSGSVIRASTPSFDNRAPSAARWLNDGSGESRSHKA